MADRPTAIVLAGGKSARLGRDKALEVVGQRTLLQRVLDSLGQVADDIVVVVSPEQTPARIPQDPKVRVVQDRHPGRGPAAGLYAGLLASRSDYSWAVSCDLPFVNPKLLSHLMALAPGYDAVIPMIEDPWRSGTEHKVTAQTLHAVYSKRCVPLLEEFLQSERSVALQDLLPHLSVRYVEKDDMDSGLRSFFNINSAADLARARSISEETG